MIVAGSFNVVTTGRLSAVSTAARRQIGFATDNRFDSLLGRFGEEFNGSEHVPMVGHCDCRHAGFFGVFEQRTDLAGPIKQAVLGMNVQMDETHKPARPPQASAKDQPTIPTMVIVS